jgi:hypothetical protein
MSPLNHQFKIEYKSCAGEAWVDRSEYAEDTNWHNPYQVAASLATSRMLPTERGVRVTYLGVRVAGNGEQATTPINPFTVTIERKE